MTMSPAAQLVELREYRYHDGAWPYQLIADLRVRGGGRSAMVATRKALSAALRPDLAGEFRAGHNSSTVSLRLRDAPGRDLHDPLSILNLIDAACAGLGLGFSASGGIDAIVVARLGADLHRREAHHATTWPAHLEALRGQWAPLLEHWLFSRARAIEVADPGAVLALHFSLPVLETILARAVVSQAGNYTSNISVYGVLDGYDRAQIAHAVAALEAKGFIADVGPGSLGSLFRAKRGRRLARVPRDWLLQL
jgi:hypothetical protein